MANIKKYTVTVGTSCSDSPFTFVDVADELYGTAVLNQLKNHQDIHSIMSSGGESAYIDIPFGSVCFAIIGSESVEYVAPEDETCVQ